MKVSGKIKKYKTMMLNWNKIKMKVKIKIKIRMFGEIKEQKILILI